MRKRLFILGSITLLGILFCYQKLAAQNTSPFWSLAGNSNATAASKLGTTNAIPLRLLTKNLERLRIDTAGRVGIGTINPVYKLHVLNTAASQTTIYGQATGAGSYGVWGSGVTRGVFGSSTSGYGVYGQGTYGVYGTGTSRGVWGVTASASGYGVYGQGSNTSPGKGVYGTGFYGVYGSSTVSSGDGVYGNATGASSAGVYGNNTNSSGVGVKGVSPYQGVYGQGGSYGVFGFTSTGNGVYGKGGSIGTVGEGGTYGVYGIGDSYGVFGSTTNGYGTYGSSTNGTGAYGFGGSNGGYFVGNTGSTSTYGVQAYGGYTGVYANAPTYAIWGSSSFLGVYGSGTSYGVYGSGNYGVYGISSASNGNGVYGIFSSSSNTGDGVYGYNGNTGYGVQSYCNQGTAFYGYSDHNYGIFVYTNNSSTYAGYFGGKVYSTGGYYPSDRRLKQNITDMTNAIDIINKLQPKYYEYRQDGNYKLMNLPQGKQFGLIAQDVEQVLPGLISETEFDPNLAKRPAPPVLSTDGKPAPGTNLTNQSTAGTEEKINFKAINYTELIPILVKAVQEQQQEINQLKDQISKLTLGQSINTIADNSLLDQNSPNPARRSTSIRYSIPQGSSDAQLILTNNLGQTIKTLRLSSSGTINLDASTLSSGVYNYSLIVNGKVVDTKKMTVTRD